MPDTNALMARMAERQSDLRGLGYRVRFDVTDNGDAILLDGTGAVATLELAGPDDAADSVLRLSAADLAKLIEGRLSPMLAFSTGRLKVEGSKGVALKLASLLDRD
jgi:putative sterol carrier protein